MCPWGLSTCRRKSGQSRCQVTETRRINQGWGLQGAGGGRCTGGWDINLRATLRDAHKCATVQVWAAAEVGEGPVLEPLWGLMPQWHRSWSPTAAESLTGSTRASYASSLLPSILSNVLDLDLYYCAIRSILFPKVEGCSVWDFHNHNQDILYRQYLQGAGFIDQSVRQRFGHWRACCVGRNPIILSEIACILGVLPVSYLM